MGIASDISALKTLSDGVVANKVSRFAYTESAYTDNQVNGVPDYDVNRAQNIPVGTPTIMKVNQTVVDKGWRARASSITRMLMNHFLGRISYNLNKVNDWFNALLVALSSSLGTANGIATLNSNAYVQQPQGVVTKSFLSAMLSWALGNVWCSSNVLFPAYIVKYAKGLWVCGTSTQGMFWSEDAYHWTQASGVPSAETIRYCLGYFKSVGLWLCGTSSNQYGVWWSEDGKTWTQGTGELGFTNATFKDIIEVDNLLVASSNDGVWWSEDGKTWTQGTNTTNLDVGTIIYANNIFVLSTRSNGGVWWSEDGKTWTQGTGLPSGTHDGIYFLGGLFFCIGSGWCWSEDGKTWTQGTGDNVTNDYGLSSLAFAHTKADGGVWVGVSGTHGAWWSADGKTWTQGTGDVITNAYGMGRITYANGVFLCATNSNGYWKSVNGRAWTATTVTTGGNSVFFQCINGVWFSSAGYRSSDNGETWVKTFNGFMTVTNRSNNYNTGITCADGKIVTGTTTYGIYVSSIDDLIDNGAVSLGEVIIIING